MINANNPLTGMIYLTLKHKSFDFEFSTIFANFPQFPNIFIRFQIRPQKLNIRPQQAQICSFCSFVLATAPLLKNKLGKLYTTFHFCINGNELSFYMKFFIEYYVYHEVLQILWQ